MQIERSKLQLIGVAAGVVILGLTSLLVLNFLQRFTAPDDSSAGANSKLILTRITPANADLLPGDSLSIAVSADDTADATVAEVVVTFDPTVLHIEGITESDSLLALNKTKDNLEGKLTIDIANTGGVDLEPNATLVVLKFVVQSEGIVATTIRIDPASTLGYPNLVTANGYGVLATPLLISKSGSVSSTSLNSSASLSSSVSASSSVEEESSVSSSSSASSSVSSVATSRTSLAASSSRATASASVSSSVAASSAASTGGGNIIDQNPVVFMVVAVTGAIAAAAGAAGLWFSGKNDATF